MLLRANSERRYELATVRRRHRSGRWRQLASAGRHAIEDFEGVRDARDVDAYRERCCALAEQGMYDLGNQASANQFVHRLGHAKVLFAPQGLDGLGGVLIEFYCRPHAAILARACL